jgi:hypothetical protein
LQAATRGYTARSLFCGDTHRWQQLISSQAPPWTGSAAARPALETIQPKSEEPLETAAEDENRKTH